MTVKSAKLTARRAARAPLTSQALYPVRNNFADTEPLLAHHIAAEVRSFAGEERRRPDNETILVMILGLELESFFPVTCILGNPLICGSHSSEKCSESFLANPLSFALNPSSGRTKTKKLAIALGLSLTFVSILGLALGFLFQRTNKKRKQSVLNITDVQEEDLIRLGNL
ncbi:Leucine-rich repeat protein kinase family protein [Perilla frutescens var. hirtella]|nr:Leucine-rich repeat protein kinase family protein [Perilla frutescens var. hirtella]